MNANIELKDVMGKTILQMTVDNQEEIDEIAVKMLHSDCPEFIGAFTQVEINGDTIFRYDIGNLISLEYFGTTLPGKDFVRLLKNLSEPLTACNDWMLDYRSFCFNPSYVFIDRYTFAIKYVYYPLMQATAEEKDIKNLFKFATKLCDSSDNSALQVELYRLYSEDKFSISALMEIISKHSQEKSFTPSAVVQNIHVESIKPNEQPVVQVKAEKSALNIPVEKAEPPKNTANMTAEELLNLQILQGLSEGEKTSKGKKNTNAAKEPKSASTPKSKGSFFERFGKKSVPEENFKKEVLSGAPKDYLDNVAASQNNYQRPIAVVEESDSRTEIVNASRGYSSVFLSLSKDSPLNIPRRIDLDFSNGGLKVGRSDSKANAKQNDVEFPTEIKSVSRMHARIEKSGSDYVVIDLGSANGTYINSVRIASNVPSKITSGDCVSFSQKGVDYIFNA